MNPTNPTNDPVSQQAANPADPMQAGVQPQAPNPGQNQASVQPMMPPAAPPLASPQVADPMAMPAPQAADIAGTQAQQNAQASIPTDVVATTKNPAAKIIEDKDLIEKEWVEKAKKIVDANSGDPYKQSEQLTAFRAEYMQKEYNKTIKTDT